MNGKEHHARKPSKLSRDGDRDHLYGKVSILQFQARFGRPTCGLSGLAAGSPDLGRELGLRTTIKTALRVYLAVQGLLCC